jgi:hypothetical protein
MRIGLSVAATVTAALALAPPAQADSYSFQSPSGNIACMLGAYGVACDISDYTYQPPPPPQFCPQHWGNRFALEPGQPAALHCHGDALLPAGQPTLDYGQSKSAGTFTCTSELSGVRCADSSSGHYFRVSRDSFDLG